MEDERQRLYSRALIEREYLPIRGKWAFSIKKYKEKKRKEKEEQRNRRTFIYLKK